MILFVHAELTNYVLYEGKQFRDLGNCYKPIVSNFERLKYFKKILLKILLRILFCHLFALQYSYKLG